ncbi:PRC-barrel domain-containing protein [Spirulina sp. CCNP1310]|uniref:PRC-barrel domain-containing protein n=1 Tax=Spirulina sp. CCNP1310 TaxID=3110249 RepID=UPI002B21FC41|nr:PRC-barrel domain-containing protein [Spirulina sp. CCNP1310]MEA5421333.1 PRC-barrel domain-containing protein [Spirulina sp. CCNP1310]
MTTDTIRLRSEFINTKVITNDSARQLGVVKNLLVDIDRREVVALGLRDNLLAMTGMPKYMYLSSIERAGDVLLVPNEDVIEEVDAEAYSNLVNCEVITEVGELLGRVRDFQFSVEDGQVVSLIIASIGLPMIPEQVLSTYELPVEEIVSTGPNRIIVFEGSEERLKQITVGLLERVGIGRAPWERDEEDPYYTPTARPENQLGTGIPVNARPVAPPLERPYEPAWDEDEWAESQPRSLPKRQAKAVRYEDDYEGESNWSEPRRPPQRAAIEREPAYDPIENDVWDDEPEPYQAPPVNIPEKRPEYDEY